MRGTGEYMISNKDGKGILRSLRRVSRKEGRIRPYTAYIVGFAEDGHTRREREYTSLSEALRRLETGLPAQPREAKKISLRFPDREALSRKHRDAVLSLAYMPFQKSAFKRAHMIKGQTGSFAFALGHSPEDFFSFLASREAFLEAVEAEREKSSIARGTHSPKAKIDTWEAFSPDSPKKASLSIEIPNDLPEDVYAEVRRMLLRQGSRDIEALPCHTCGRRFDFEDFLREAEEKISEPEQVEALEALRLAFKTGELQEACPVLWYALGISPPYVAREDGSPYGNTAEEYRCGLHGLASKYSWKASFRILYERARSAMFVDSRQDKFGREVEDWEAREEGQEDQRSPSPEDVILEALREDELYEGLTRSIRASTSRKPFADSLLRLLGRAREDGIMPTGEEAAKISGIATATAYNHVSELYSRCWAYLEAEGIVAGERREAV